MSRCSTCWTFDVQLGWRRQYCGVQMLKKDGVLYYFLDNKYYFGRPYIYGLGGDEYERYGFFCRACLNALPLLDFSPDIIHAHDWQSGMIPALLKIQYAHLPSMRTSARCLPSTTCNTRAFSASRTCRMCWAWATGCGLRIKLECFGLRQLYEGRPGLCRCHHHRKPQLRRGNHHCYYGERLDG